MSNCWNWIMKNHDLTIRHKCCLLAVHYVLPKDRPGPNLHFCFMKNGIHTSLLGSLIIALSFCSILLLLEALYETYKGFMKAQLSKKIGLESPSPKWVIAKCNFHYLKRDSGNVLILFLPMDLKKVFVQNSLISFLKLWSWTLG